MSSGLLIATTKKAGTLTRIDSNGVSSIKYYTYQYCYAHPENIFELWHLVDIYSYHPKPKVNISNCFKLSFRFSVGPKNTILNHDLHE